MTLLTSIPHKSSPARFVALSSILFICAIHEILLGQEDAPAPKWNITIHKHGRETSHKAIPVSNELSQELDLLSKRCSNEAIADFHSYAPSIRIETELERIDFRAKSVVYSTRIDVKGTWHQRSLKCNENDKKMRQRIIDFAATKPDAVP